MGIFRRSLGKPIHLLGTSADISPKPRVRAKTDSTQARAVGSWGGSTEELRRQMKRRIQQSIVLLAMCVFAAYQVSPAWAQTETVIDIDASGTGTCVVKSNGSVWCVGGNEYGQLGDGATIDRASLTQVKGLPKSKAISVGDAHACAIDQRSRVWCWGRNQQGQLGRGNLVPSTKPVLVAITGRAVSIAAGFDHTCVVLSNGKIACWGGNSHGQLGDGTRIQRKKPVMVRTKEKATQTETGRWYSCATFRSGVVQCWGRNFGGQLGNQPVLADGYTGPDELLPVPVTDIGSAASVHLGDGTCVLLRDASVRCWGYYWTEIARELLEPAYVLWPSRVEGLGQVLRITRSNGIHDATCALERSGTVKCWGDDSSPLVTPGVGQDNSFEDPLPPTDISLPGAAVLIASGDDHACAYLASNELWCWGTNWYGQLGVPADQELTQYEPIRLAIP